VPIMDLRKPGRLATVTNMPAGVVGSPGHHVTRAILWRNMNTTPTTTLPYRLTYLRGLLESGMTYEAAALRMEEAGYTGKRGQHFTVGAIAQNVRRHFPDLRRRPGVGGRKRKRYTGKSKGKEYWHTLEGRIASIKGGAKQRGLEFDISQTTLSRLYDTPCRYCGSKVEHCLGLDRVDSSKGYVSDNVVQCCTTCNRAKQDMSTAEFLEWIVKVYNNLKGGKRGHNPTNVR
jgi:hypothetical protein